MTALRQHVLGFSPHGDLFAFINEQGILRIWNTETNTLKQEYTPNLHLTGPCTSLMWLVTRMKGGKKNQKKNTSFDETETEQLYIALGNSNGKVSLYSYALGKIERTLKGEGHSGKVTSITQNNEGLLFTCGKDRKVIVWSLQEETEIRSWSIGTEKPFSIAYMPNSKCLVVGCRQIKVFDLETQELVQSFTGHTSDINTISTFAVGEIDYVATASTMERIICVWKLGKRKQNTAAFCTLLMENIAQSLTCDADSKGNVRVATVTRSGVIHVYQLSLERVRKDKPIKPNLTLEIASGDAATVEPIPAIAVSVQHNNKSQEILFCYGDKHFVIFEQLIPSFKEKMQVLVRQDPRQKLTKPAEKNQIPDTVTTLKSLEPKINQSQVDYKSTVTIPKKNLKPLDMPMESRLENLNLNSVSGKSGPQAQSKVELLVQALHSKDAKLLRTVLSTENTNSIQLTLQRLPVRYIGALVNELTLLMQRSRKNVEIATNWLKILSQTHSSQLLALGADELLNKFGPCIGIIEHRSHCLKELSKLNGRLQLLVGQIKRNAEADNLNIENVLVYEDNDSSASDIEDNETVRQSESDSYWDEDFDDEEDEIQQDFDANKTIFKSEKSESEESEQMEVSE